MNELPLNGRNFTSLVMISAGVTTVAQDASILANSRLNGSVFEFSINGSRAASVSYLIDGTTDNSIRYQFAAAIPSADAIEEFKLQDGQYSTEYGAGNAQVNVAIKSGTNSLHGSAYDFIRNDYFQPDNVINNALNKLNNTHLPLQTPLKQNQFGASVGGPIRLPKIYNGKDRSFFFFSYEGGRRRTGSTAQNASPTAAEKQGDFSDTPYPIYDPSTTGSVAATTSNPTGRLAYPGNQIPTTAFNPIAKNLLKYFPTANITCTLPCSNYYVSIPGLITTDNMTARVDHAFTSNDRLTVTLYAARDHEPSNSIEGPTVAFTQVTRTELGGGEWTHSFGSNAVNSLRFGAVREFFAYAGQTGYGPDLSTEAGFKNGTQIPAYFDIPQTVFNDRYAGPGAYNNGFIEPNSTFQYLDNFKLIRGKHEITVGADIRRHRFTDNYGATADGSMTYTGAYTAANPAAANAGTISATSGNPFADFLLGDPLNISAPGVLGSQLVYVRSTWWDFFFQDNYRVTPKLTFNLGLRYELNGAWHSTDDSGEIFDPTNGTGMLWASKAFVNSAVPNATYYRCCSVPSLIPTDKHDFSPRFGFAWRPFAGNNKFVVRSAYGIFVDTSMAYFDVYAYNENVLSTLSPAIYPQDTGFESTSPNNLSNLWLPVRIIQPGSTLAPRYLQGMGATWPSNRNPYNQQWTLDLQYALTPNTLLDVAYQGLHGLRQTDIWYPNTGYSPTVPGDACNTILDASLATGANAHCLTDPNFQPVDTRDPYPLFSPQAVVRANQAYNNYEGLQVKVEHRVSHGLALLGNYTYSKNLGTYANLDAFPEQSSDGVLYQDPHNIAASYGPSAFDITHRAVISYSYDVPVGHGKRWSFGKADYILGGWSTSGTITFAGGLPFGLFAFPRSGTDEWGSTRTGRVHVNLSGDPRKGFTQSVLEWFNPNVTSQPQAGTYGNASTNFLRSTPQRVGNIALLKTFPVKETRFNFEYRLELFNALSSSYSYQHFPTNTYTTSPGGPAACTPGPSGTCNYGSLVALNGLGALNLWSPYTMQMALKLRW